MLYFKFIIIFHNLILIYAGYIQDKLLNSKVLHVTRIDGECRGENVPQKSFHLGIRSETWGIVIANSTLIATEDLPNDLQMNLTIHKCQSRENLDSCEEVGKYKNMDFCQAINPDNLITSQSPFAVHYVPKLKCPVKKGTYRAYNTTLTLAPFMFLKLDSCYYRLKNRIFSPSDNYRLIYCLAAEALIKNSKSQK